MRFYPLLGEPERGGSLYTDGKQLALRADKWRTRSFRRDASRVEDGTRGGGAQRANWDVRARCRVDAPNHGTPQPALRSEFGARPLKGDRDDQQALGRQDSV